MTAAKSWISYGPEHRLTATASPSASIPQDGTTRELTQELEATGAPFFVEHVYIYLDLDHSARGDLELVLVSPGGTESLLNPGGRPETTNLTETRNTPICSATEDPCPTANDGVCDFLTCGCDYNDCGGDAMPFDYGPPTWNWKMATVRSWGESPEGTWTLKITDKRPADTHATATVNHWSVFVYGHRMHHADRLTTSRVAFVLGVLWVILVTTAILCFSQRQTRRLVVAADFEWVERAGEAKSIRRELHPVELQRAGANSPVHAPLHTSGRL